MIFMKKVYLLSTIVLIFVIMLVGCNSENKESESSNSEDEVFELNINNWAPSTHHFAGNVYEPWKKLVEEETDGQVIVNIYHGSSLGESESLYQDVRGGTYEVGVAVANYFYDTDFFPYTIGSLPFALGGTQAGADILPEFAEKYAHEDLDDVIIMGETASDGYDLFSSKPIRKAEDLKGLKMRVNGKSENAFVKALGATPVNITAEDTYDGLQKGTIDTTFYSPVAGVGLKFIEPAPYLSEMRVTASPIVPIMNKEFYEGLPEDLQKLFAEELNPKLTDLFTESYLSELDNSLEVLAEETEGRGEIITFEDEDFEVFESAGKEAWDVWKEDAEKKGYPAEEMIEDYFEMLEEEGYPLPY